MKALIFSLVSCWLVLAMAVGHAQTVTKTTTVVTAVEPEFGQAELDQMLAPIALYPDTVLSHILIASTYPLEVVQADRWAQANRGLDAEEAVNAAELENWDPSVKALVAFPDILRRMSDDLDWTQRLGDAFLADETLVMDTIQGLRNKAYASGNLRDTKYVKVQREKKIIVIEPAVERVVYIPYYDTRVVYGNWWWDRYPPVYWHHPVSYVHVGGFYWGPRTYLSTSFFFSSPHWHQRRIVVIDYHRHDHHHPRFYSGRKIARYDGAHHWQHNPRHRHNVSYRSERVRHKYHHDDGGGRFVRDSRDRDGHQNNRNDHQNNWRKHDDKRFDANRDRDQRDDRQQPKFADRDRDGDRFREQNNRQVSAGQIPASAREQRETRDKRSGDGDKRARFEGAPSRADQVRERLANNQPREVRSRESSGDDQKWRERDKQASWRNTDNLRDNNHRNDNHRNDNAERKTHFQGGPKQAETRTEIRRDEVADRREPALQRAQPQNPAPSWRSERKEQAAQQDREIRRAELPRQEPVRQEAQRQEQRNWPQQRSERQMDNRRQEQARSMPSPRGNDQPRPERENRRFER